jgi:hypothetical protein
MLVQGVPFKKHLNNSHVTDSLNPPPTFKSSPWLLGRVSRQLRKSCAGANMVYSRAERALISEHYRPTESSADGIKTCMKAYRCTEALSQDNCTQTGGNISGRREVFVRRLPEGDRHLL